MQTDLCFLWHSSFHRLQTDVLCLVISSTGAVERSAVGIGGLFSVVHPHTGKCIRRFAGIYAYCRYFMDRKW